MKQQRRTHSYRTERERPDKGEGLQAKKKKWSYFFENNTDEIDFKDNRLLSKFITERGKILPRRITGVNAKQQKVVTQAVKRARQMGIIPFVAYGPLG